MNENHFLSIYRELLDENPFAVRAVLRILEISFTSQVPTLAVTCEERPRLLVNLDFIARHCHTEAHVKAVITHEFLHVLLRHTETRAMPTRARHIAFDAVINAIIHRTQGAEWSSMMSKYYAKATDLTKLLRPMTPDEDQLVFSAQYSRDAPPLPAWVRAWDALYRGKLVADDIAELAEDISTAANAGVCPAMFTLSGERLEGLGDLLGNHSELGDELPPEMKAALQQAMQEMNGKDIWRNQPPGLANNTAADVLEQAANGPIRGWERNTLAVLRRYLTPDKKTRRFEEEDHEFIIPVLSAGDRRAFMRSLWDPILPQARWPGTARRKAATAQIYLDVSGSMNAEMPHLIALLARLSPYIRRPFWAFSDEVAPARIEKGQLVTRTTGGTSMACVLRHVIASRPAAAIVLTDGYIERLDPTLVREALGRTRLHALVSRSGSPAALKAAGLSYTQLQRYPS